MVFLESLEASTIVSEYVYQFLLLCLHHPYSILIDCWTSSCRIGNRVFRKSFRLAGIEFLAEDLYKPWWLFKTRRNRGTKHAFGAEYVFDPRLNNSNRWQSQFTCWWDSATLNYFAGLTVSQTVSSVTLLDMCNIPKLKGKKKGL